ncbi:hypothetical protein LVJ94_06645 [Pendulispora rubella]|uniref:Ribosomal protein S19 n=1 Tax=Pendulispora rubella TaxID=2741070 RepID=A0ABZ2LAH2_9BACT
MKVARPAPSVRRNPGLRCTTQTRAAPAKIPRQLGFMKGAAVKSTAEIGSTRPFVAARARPTAARAAASVSGVPAGALRVRKIKHAPRIDAMAGAVRFPLGAIHRGTICEISHARMLTVRPMFFTLAMDGIARWPRIQGHSGVYKTK